MLRCPPSSPAITFILAFLAVAVGGCGESLLSEEDSAAPFEPTILNVDPLEGLQSSAKTGDRIRGQYIVMLREDLANADAVTSSLLSANAGQLLYRYNYAVKGFAARLSESAVEALSNNPNVVSVEQDGIVTVTDSGTQPSPPSWGLDRIDQHSLPLDGLYGYESDGRGVWAYIIDTGLNYDHEEFGSSTGGRRAFLGLDALGGVGWDCHGHGTHVAGTLGGTTYGVAKESYLIAVRVLDCNGNGTYSSVIAGVDYVTMQKTQVLPADPAVANMSLGGPLSPSLNTAVSNSVAAGVTYAVAAGNDNTDACSASPASTAAAITAGATTDADQRASYSNFGTCVDVFAPGSNILSAFIGSTTASQTWSGTSMASPHVAGTAAIYLSLNPGALPDEVTEAIESAATAGAVGNAGTGSPNLLLYSLLSGGTPPPPPPPADPVRIHVESISPIVTSGKKRTKGSTVVTVNDDAGLGVANVVVSGRWVVGSAIESTSTATDSNGQTSVTSSNYVGNPSFEFCVLSLSGTNVVDETDYSTGVCAPYGDGGSNPPPPPPSGPPTNLVAQDASRGRLQKVDLSWDNGAPSVVIYRWDLGLVQMDPIGPVANAGSYTDNLGKTSHVSITYQVCNEGQAPDGAECSARVAVLLLL